MELHSKLHFFDEIAFGLITNKKHTDYTTDRAKGSWRNAEDKP